MRKTMKIQILFILISLLLPVIVQSVSLGSFTKSNSAIVKAGERTTLEIFFWNLGDSYYLKISEKNIPEGWGISIKPNNFLLEKAGPTKPPFDEGEYINLPGIGVIKPSSVKIEIKVPKNTQAGDYDLIFKAVTSTLGGKISTSQERDINFKIRVNGNLDENLEITNEESFEEESQNQQIEPKTIDADNRESVQKNNETKETQETTESPLTGRIISGISDILRNRNLIIVLSFIGILLVSVVIYKYV